MPQYGNAPAPGASRMLGAYLYTALGTENGNFTITHSLNITAPYYVACTPQGAHDVPVIDPNPVGGSQTLTQCTIACSGPMTAADKFLFLFFSKP